MSLENRGKTPGCHCTGHWSSGRQAGKGHRRHSAGRMLPLDPEPISIRVRDSPSTLTAIVPTLVSQFLSCSLGGSSCGTPALQVASTVAALASKTLPLSDFLLSPPTSSWATTQASTGSSHTSGTPTGFCQPRPNMALEFRTRPNSGKASQRLLLRCQASATALRRTFLICSPLPQTGRLMTLTATKGLAINLCLSAQLSGFCYWQPTPMIPSLNTTGSQGLGITDGSSPLNLKGCLEFCTQ